MPDVFEMPRTRRVLQGAGCSRAIAAELDERGLERALVVSGRSVSSAPAFGAIVEGLGSRVAATFTTVRAHNPVEDVLALIEAARAARADVFVGVGGGSALDSAKWAALGVLEGVGDAARLVDFEVHFQYPDTEYVNPLSGVPAPVFAVPTTLSAAEWDGFFSTTNLETGYKHVARYVELTPEVVFLDPALCAGTPRDLWATTGVRAIDHAIETSYARNAHPYTTALAYGALELLAAHLPESVERPGDHEAALACQVGAWMSIVGVHNVSLGLSHAIGHQLGGMGIPHGVTSCIMLPHVMRLLAPATAAQQERIAAILGGEGSAADRLERLFDRLGVPRTVGEFGLDRGRMGAVADATLADVVARESPVPLTREIVVELLERAW